MSEDLFYNRDQNIIGASTINWNSYSPAYGSRVSFSSLSNRQELDDGYYNLIPYSLNNLYAQFDLKYEVTQAQAKNLVNFFETKSGVTPFAFRLPVMRELSGICTSYAINHINLNHYEVAARIEVERNSPLINWHDSCFSEIDLLEYNEGGLYSLYDVVFDTGLFAASGNAFNSFFYFSGNYLEPRETVSPAQDTDGYWTQEFFFQPDEGLQNEVQFQINKVEFKNSAIDRIKTRKNTAIVPLNYKFSNISEKQAKCLLTFLERHAGYRRFRHQIPSVYNRPKVFYCPSWSLTWDYNNSYTIETSFIEDPLGVIPTDS